MEEYRLLVALRSGKHIASAIDIGFRKTSLSAEEIPEQLK